MASLTPSPKMQFFDANGNPLVGGKLYTYAAGTNNPLATYTDSTGSSANTNPIILDSRGEANVWLGVGSYKMVLRDSVDALIWTVDFIPGASYNQSGSVAFSSSTIASVNFATTQPDVNYFVSIAAKANRTFWITNKTVNGFTVNASSANSDAVDWQITR